MNVSLSVLSNIGGGTEIIDDEEPQNVLPKAAEKSGKDMRLQIYGIPLLIALFIGIILLVVFLVLDHPDESIYMSGQDKRQFDTIDKITHKVFLDITVDGTAVTTGRVTIGLFGDTVP